MIRLILHQIWNQRHQNFWIWLELTLLSVFLWLAIDPLFTMVCITQVPRGYNSDRFYCLNTRYDFKKTCFSSENFSRQMGFLLTQLSQHPMVEAVCLCDINNFIKDKGYILKRYYRSLQEAQDDAKADWAHRKHGMFVDVVAIPVFEGLEQWADLPGTLQLHDAVTGRPIHGHTDAIAKDMVFISAKMATDFYGTLHAQDSVLYFIEDFDTRQGHNQQNLVRRVEAVCGNIKMRDYQTPSAILFCPEDADFMKTVPLVRLKKGVDGEDFKAAMEKDVFPRCVIDNVRRIDVRPLARQVQKATERSGAYNTIRLRSAMGFFGLLCAFLGVSGLFWVRCNDRRQDMGVMRSMGATRRDVRRWMLFEGVLLLTMAFLPAMSYVLWHVHAHGYDVGMAENTPAGTADMAYWFNRPVPHVAAVTAIAYISMLLVTLLATWLPVQRATRILPGDALRDE